MAQRSPPSPDRSKGVDSADFVTLVDSPDPVALISTIRESWQTGNYSDITLSIRGKKIKAHKLMVASYCHELKDQISTESDRQEISLDLDPSLVQNVLSFVYCNKITVRKDEVQSLSKVAVSLGVYSLAEKCIQALLASSAIGIDNCFSLISMANQIGDEDFVETAMSFALKHFPQVQKTSQFIELSADDVEDYLCHSDLNVSCPEERFGACLFWAKHDSATRIPQLGEMLDSLPLRQMKKWYTDQVLLDPALKDYSDICRKIEQTHHILNDADRHKADICQVEAKSQRTEKCLILVDVDAAGRKSNEVMAVRKEHNFEIVSLGHLGAEMHGQQNRYISCCVQDKWLYVCGLGPKYREIWRFHLQQQISEKCGRLNVPRTDHTMGVGGDGKIYIIGGYTPGFLGDAKALCGRPLKIEVLDTTNMEHGKAGLLRYPVGGKLVCCSTDKGFHFLVFGAASVTSRPPIHYIQVFDIGKGSTDPIIKYGSEFGDYEDMYTALRVKDSVFAFGPLYTLVSKMEDILAGRDDRIFICKNYTVPNEWCVATESMDGQSVILLGGKPRKGKPKVFVYEAKIEDIWQDAKQGWQPSNIPWKLGPCQLHGGYATANIVIGD